MINPSDENAAKRRKVRKGTHSCWECRRRKVKCIFASQQDIVCITCNRRGAKCLSQLDVDSPEIAKTNARQAVPPEASYDQLIRQTSGNAQSDLRDVVADYATSTCSLPSGYDSNAISLASSSHGDSPGRFLNGRNQTHAERPTSMMPTPAPSHMSPAVPSKYAEITQALLKALPSQEDIELLLGAVKKVSLMCYQSGLKASGPIPVQQIATPNLLSPEDHPILLARQMLLFASALQHVSAREVIPRISRHHHVIMETLAETVIKLVTTDDTLLGTLESLEIIVLEVYYHIDRGNIRRAWITVRRAVTTGQLLGLHRQGNRRFKVASEQCTLDPEVMWLCIVSMELTLSMLLGLPTSTGSAGNSPQIAVVASTDWISLSAPMICAMGKILERNQTLHENEAHVVQRGQEMTHELDRQLIKLAEQMPSTYWRPIAFEGLQVDSLEALSEARRIWDHIGYFSTLNQLHLPYMVCSENNTSGLYSRMACANASREILTRQIAFRKFNSITAFCRIGDFMALIAGMTLMLAHILSHCQTHRTDLLAHQRLGDRATVEGALDCMEAMSELSEDVLASKCAMLLKSLLAIEANAWQGQAYRVGMDGGMSVDQAYDACSLIIKVPYVGAIKISREGMTSMEIAEGQGFHEGINYGSSGALNGHSTSRPGQGDGASIVDDPNAPATTGNAVQLAPDDLFMQQGQMFPDAAASLNDWAFQGCDTAFFDLLTRGGGDHLHSTGTEAWDFNAFAQ